MARAEQNFVAELAGNSARNWTSEFFNWFNQANFALPGDDLKFADGRENPLSGAAETGATGVEVFVL